MTSVTNDDYVFTNDWFENTIGIWDGLIPQIKPRSILEVGSHEGKSVCYLIERLACDFPIEIHCVDTWEGGVEHKAEGVNMSAVEHRFHHNVKRAIARIAKNNVDLVTHKGKSDFCLSRMLSEGKGGYFDFVYIDGSHQAPDVLLDAVLGFKLVKVGGVMAFDDYNWWERLPTGKDPLRMPKPAIDAFVNINIRKLSVLNVPATQLWLQKTSD